MNRPSAPPPFLRRRDWLRWSVAGAAAATAWPAAWSQGRGALEGGALRIVVPYPAGGSSDAAARLLAEALGPRLGVPVGVDNRPGAGGRLAAQQVHRDNSGQNVVLLGNPAVMLVAPLVFKDNGYDTDRDYAALSQITRYAFGVAVGTGVPVRGFPQLHAWMVAHRDRLSAGVPATGSLPHFFALMLAEQLGLTLPVVGYRGSAPLLDDLMGGHIPLAIDALDALEPLHKEGKLRILAISDDQRSPELPTVPTFKETGLPLSAHGWNALYAPAWLPAPRARRIAEATAQAMADKSVQAQFTAAHMVPVASSREQTLQMLATYKAQWTPVVRRSGFQP